jgi:glycosyltransferase involved in cell wall biosynthesis
MAAIWLARQGYRVTFAGPGEAGAATLATPVADVAAEILTSRRGRLSAWWHVRLLLKILRHRLRGGRDAVFYVQGSGPCAAAYFALLGWPRRRLIYHTQDFLEPGRHRLWEFFERQVAQRAGRVICNEPNRARFLASHYRLAEMPAVVRTGLPRDWPAPERDAGLRRGLLARVGPVGGGEPRLIMAGGGYSPVRCTAELIEAVGRLAPRYVLVFTGMAEGSPGHRAAVDAARQAGVAGRVLFLPHLAYDELLRHMAACDVGVLLYPNDGIGNFYQAPGRLTEYLKAGLPVVASNFPGLELLALKYGLGRVCDPQSPRAIAGAIDALGSRGEAELAAERRRLRDLAQTEFAYETQAWRIEQAIRGLAGAGGEP